MELKITVDYESDLCGGEYLNSEEIEMRIKPGNNCIFLWLDGDANPVVLKREHVELMLVLVGNKD